MIQIILFIVGVTALIKKKITFSKTSELRRPNTIYFGITTIVVLILSVALDFYRLGLTKDRHDQIDYWVWVVYALSFIIPIMAAFLLRQPKTPEKQIENQK